MAKIITAAEAAALIPDGATVGIAGMGLSGWPEEVACAIRDSFKQTGHPRDLNLKQGSAMGDWKDRGATRLGEAGPGLVTRWSGAHVGSAYALRDLAVKNQLQCHCLPQGVIVNLWREIAAGRPGLLTKVGLGTFVDRESRAVNERVLDGHACGLVEFAARILFYKNSLRGTEGARRTRTAISFGARALSTSALSRSRGEKREHRRSLVEYLAKGTLNLGREDPGIRGLRRWRRARTPAGR